MCLKKTEADRGQHYHGKDNKPLDRRKPRTKVWRSQAKLKETTISSNNSTFLQEGSSQDETLSAEAVPYSTISTGPPPESTSSKERSHIEHVPRSEETALQISSVLENAAQHRVQLFQRFFDLHIGASSTARRVFAFEALETTSPMKVATKSAMQTLCITQVATSFEDYELMKVARSLYAESVRILFSQMGAIKLDRPDKAQLSDVIGCIHALTSCAWFKCIVDPDDLEWMRYTKTTLNILEVFGWDPIDPSIKRALHYNWEYRAFFDALIHRSKVSFIEPPDDFITERGSRILPGYAFDVPGLLWRTDKFIEVSKSVMIDSYMVIRLLTEIGACLSRLKSWNLQWMKRYPRSSHYRTLGTKAFKDFRALCGEYFNVFALAYDFSNALHERDLRIFSMCVLNLDQAIMDIHKTFPEHCSSDQLKVQLREAELSAETCAADLCMLIPWATQRQNMAFASIHSFLPLHFASTYYERQGKLRQLAWCRNVIKSLSTKYGIEIKYPK